MLEMLLGRPLPLDISPSPLVLLFIARTAAARGAAVRAGLARARSALPQPAVASTARSCLSAFSTASPSTQRRTTRAAVCSSGAAGIGAVVHAPRPSRCPVARGPAVKSSAGRQVARGHDGMGPPPPIAPRMLAVARLYHVLRRGVVATSAQGIGPVPLQLAAGVHPRESPTRTDAPAAPAVVRPPVRLATVARLALGKGGMEGQGRGAEARTQAWEGRTGLMRGCGRGRSAEEAKVTGGGEQAAV